MDEETIYSCTSNPQILHIEDISTNFHTISYKQDECFDKDRIETVFYSIFSI